MQKKNQIKFNLLKPLPHDLFDQDALRVYQRLRNNGFVAYFVGGCIRDLLLRNTPKDFDLVTSAHPRQIRRIFSNSRIIGRRFRLVNVFFGDKIIEVTTFRKTPWKNGEPSSQKKLLIQDDNFFGTDKEDAMRRDFTINALLYAPDERIIVDYTSGLKDLECGKIRTIGDSKVRLAEDPVRIIRAIKFSACLGFDLTPDLYKAIIECSHFLERTPSARILLEFLKILRARKVYFCFNALAKFGVLPVIVPEISKALEDSKTEPYQMLHRYFRALDALADKDRSPLKDESLLTIPCWSVLIKNNYPNKIPFSVFEKTLESITTSLSLSKRLRQSIYNIIMLQHYFNKKSKAKIRSQYIPDIEAAIEVLKIRMLMGDVSERIYDYWSYETQNFFKRSRKK